MGLREPSTVFVLGADSEPGIGEIADRMAGGEDSIAVIEDRWHGDLVTRSRSATPRSRRPPAASTPST